MGGADQEYTDTYGVNSDGSSLTLGFVTEGPYSTNIGSRTFLMADDNAYQLFQLKNKEFTYTVDDSQLDCGLNGALYFVQMDADGGSPSTATPVLRWVLATVMPSARTTSSSSTVSPGSYRGPCGIDTGVPTDVEVNQADATVKFSDIKFGPIGSTISSAVAV